MSWFGFGGSGKEEKPAPSATLKVDDFDSAAHFDNTPSTFAPSAGSSVGGGFGGGGSFEQQVMMEQQRLLIQGVMMRLTEVSFDNCITKPSSSLSYNERSCISATVGKYLDTNNLISARFGGGGAEH